MKRSGLSLMELLITMAILSVVMGIIAGFFVQQSRASHLQKAINETSEASRVALSLITWDLQTAGYRVPFSSTNPTLKTSYPLPAGATASDNSRGLFDQITTRFRDDSLATPENRRVSYGVSGGSLLRANYTDDPAFTPTMEESVKGIVALNVRYETRQDQFNLPTKNSSNVLTCATGQTPIYTNGNLTNCSVPWGFSDTPQRLVRQVLVQVLARSSERISGYKSPVTSYSFSGASNYTPEAGYVYQFSEQIIVAPNLGR